MIHGPKPLGASLLGLLLFASSLSAGEMLTWTKKDGTEFEAEFVKAEHVGSRIPVTFRKPDGTEMTVGFAGLSEDDRKYVRQQAKAQKQPETAGRKARRSDVGMTGEYPLIAGTWDNGTIEQKANKFVADDTATHWHGDGVISQDGSITIKGVYTHPTGKQSETSTGKISPDGKTIRHSVWDGGACDWTWRLKKPRSGADACCQESAAKTQGGAAASRRPAEARVPRGKVSFCDASHLYG